MTNEKKTFIALTHDGRGGLNEAREVGRVQSANIRSALRLARKKFGREVEYIVTKDGEDFLR